MRHQWRIAMRAAIEQSDAVIIAAKLERESPLSTVERDDTFQQTAGAVLESMPTTLSMVDPIGKDSRRDSPIGRQAESV
ncbi:MAG TPA: hypothetical protein VJL88_04470, partial [Nitrospira sp.]|nr:hypothetical protein [Nitrospira sp.]